MALLEAADRVTDGGLREAQAIGGLGEAADPINLAQDRKRLDIEHHR
jgi:hypothetical protein